VDTPTSTLPPETRPAPIRWLRWLAGAAVAGVLLAVLLFAIRQWQAADRLHLALEELDHIDPGWRLQDIEAAREPVADAENGALLVSVVAKTLPKGWPPKTLDKLWRWPPAERLTPEERDRLETELRTVRPAAEAARGLLFLPKGRFPLQYARNPLATLFPEQEETYQVVRLLSFEATLRAEMGDAKGAMQSCRAAFHGAASLGDEPTLLSQHTRNGGVAGSCFAAERVLAQGEPDPRDMEDLQKDLGREDEHNGLLIALRGQRAMVHEVFVLIESGELRVQDLLAGLGGDESPLGRYLPGLTWHEVRADHSVLLSLLTRRTEAAGRPCHEQVAADRAFDVETKELPTNPRLARKLLGQVRRAGTVFRCKHAHVRSLVAAIAAERYRRAHGTWPKTLDDLSPAFLAAVPPDPFDGAPLRYKRLADGIVVYSVGPDGIDNGGTLDREDLERRGTDLGCQLWDVAQRRRPPSSTPPAATSP
jgi:hypothetical protein